MAEQKSKAYTDETRHQFGGDFRARRALRLRDGSLSPRKPKNKRSLIPSEPGGIINKSNPELEIAITAVELSNFPSANTQRLQMIEMGWRYCQFDEWDIAPRFREIWERSSEGKIVSNAGGGYSLALVWCPADSVRSREKEMLEWSDKVEETFESKLASHQDHFDQITGQKDSRRLMEQAVDRHMDSQDVVVSQRK